MAVTIYNEVTLDANSNADATGGWNAGNQDTDSQIEGTACVGAKTGNGLTRYFFTNGTTLNFSSGGGAEGRACYVWYNFLTAGFLDTAVNGGVRGFTSSNGATAFEEFTAPQITNDTYNGGWANVVIWPGVADNAGDFSGGTYNNAAVEAFGITYNSTSNIMGNFNNGLVDHITIAEGLQTTGTGQTFADFVTAETNNVYGIFLTQNGIFFPQGKVRFGDGSTTTVFTSSGETVVFTEQPAGLQAGFYEILFETASTSTFGNLASGVTSGGTSFGCATTTQPFVWNVNGTATLNFYASILDCASAINLNSNTTFQGSTISGSGQIDVAGATITDCVITSSTTGALSGAIAIDSPTEMTNVTNTTFSNNTNAIEITAAGTYDFNALIFSGNSNTVYFSPTSGNLTINVLNGTSAISDVIGTDVIFNAANTTGTLTINNNVTVTITGIHGVSEVSVLENPSPYTATSLPAPTPVTVAATERVSSDIIVGDGTNYLQYTNNNGKLRINAIGTATFSGVLTDGDLAGSALVAGDLVCVFIRDDDDNPTLQLEDDGLVVADSGTGQTAPTASTIDTDTDFATFTSQFGTTLNSANSKTVSIERKEAVFQFTTGADNVVDFLVFKIGDEPVLVTNQTITTTNNNFPISQVGDRNYRDPA